MSALDEPREGPDPFLELTRVRTYLGFMIERGSSGPSGKILCLWGALLAIAVVSTPTHAKEPPEARRGFQLSHQLGLTFPAGKATQQSGDSLGKRYNWQWDLLQVGAGFKIIPPVYVGGLLGFTFGGKGSDSRVRSACRDSDTNLENDVWCITFTMRAGLEGRYSIAPAARVNPWIGYGFAAVVAAESLDDETSNRSETTTVTGWEYARLSTGISFRLGRAIGVGPYGLFALGRYNNTRTTMNGDERFDGPIDERATHFWVSLGVQTVLFP